MDSDAVAVILAALGTLGAIAIGPVGIYLDNRRRLTRGYRAETELGPYAIDTSDPDGPQYKVETWISLDGLDWNRESDGKEPSRYIRGLLRKRFQWEKKRAHILSVGAAYAQLEEPKP